MIRMQLSELRTCIESYLEDNPHTWGDAEVQIKEGEEGILVFCRQENLLTIYTIRRLE